MPRNNPAKCRSPLRATRTQAETARLFGCGYHAIDELIASNVVQVIEVGNRKLPTVSSIERALGKPITELEAALGTAPTA